VPSGDLPWAEAPYLTSWPLYSRLQITWPAALPEVWLDLCRLMKNRAPPRGGVSAWHQKMNEVLPKTMRWGPGPHLPLHSHHHLNLRCFSFFLLTGQLKTISKCFQ
jgi:hypothetical protein